jgi:dienelactone hydrolase
MKAAILLVSGILAFLPCLHGEVVTREFKTSRGGNVWIYRPDTAAEKTAEGAPCVLIAAAGSNLISGKSLSKADSKEHLPYAEAGFVVVAYDVAGDPKGAGEDIRPSVEVFAKSEFGIKDGLAALNLAMEKVPAIHKDRVYAAGHSSAGTLALQLAARTSRISACVAHAPVVDLETAVGTERIESISEAVDGFADFALYSPSKHAGILNKPLFVFHAKNDSKGIVDGLSAYRTALEKAKVPCQFSVAQTGGHYDSMISDGLPQGVKWLKETDAKRVAELKAKTATTRELKGIKAEFKEDGIHLGDFVFAAGTTTSKDFIAAFGAPDRIETSFGAAFHVRAIYDRAGVEFTWYSETPKVAGGPRTENFNSLTFHLTPEETEFPEGPRAAFSGTIVIKEVEIRSGMRESQVATLLAPKFGKEEADIRGTRTSIKRFGKCFTVFAGGESGMPDDDPVDHVFCRRPFR